MAAADEAELTHMVATAAAFDEGPIAFRYPRGEGVGVEIPDIGVPLEIGRGRIVREGSRVALLSLGTRLAECLLAAEQLGQRGLSTTVADARFAKPLDVDLLLQLQRLGAPALSPDGRFAACSVTTPSLEKNASSSQLWLFPTGRARPRRSDPSRPRPPSPVLPPRPPPPPP
mgnify:CR=1 FL=1